MQLNIKIEVSKQWIYFIGFLVIAAIALFVIAYNSGKQPAVFGHSGEEIEVKINGQPKNLNKAMDEINKELQKMPTIITGTLKNNQSIPLPQGYTESECKWIVSVKQDPAYGDPNVLEVRTNITKGRRIEICEKEDAGYTKTKCYNEDAKVFYLVICQHNP